MARRAGGARRDCITPLTALALLAVPTTSLIDAIRSALLAGLRDGARMEPDARTWEVDALVGLFRSGLPSLDRALRDTLPGLTTRVGGVYCHSRPKVSSSVGPCELGDLLVVRRYRNGDVVDDRALLLQTKTGTKITYPAPGAGTEYRQYRLYTEWPEFTYFGGLRRQIRPTRAHDGAQYGFIDVCENGCDHCHIVSARPPGRTGRSLESLLADVIVGSGGRKTTLPPRPGTTGWSRVVCDLLERSRAALYTHARAGVGSGIPDAARRRTYNEQLFLVAGAQGLPDLMAREFRMAGFERPEQPLEPPDDDGGERRAPDHRPDGPLPVLVVEIDAGDAGDVDDDRR
jgi:hypothetical protein